MVWLHAQCSRTGVAMWEIGVGLPSAGPGLGVGPPLAGYRPYRGWQFHGVNAAKPR